MCALKNRWNCDMQLCNFKFKYVKENLIWLEPQFNFVLIRWWNKSYIVFNTNFSTPCLTKHLVVPIRKEKYKPPCYKKKIAQKIIQQKYLILSKKGPTTKLLTLISLFPRRKPFCPWIPFWLEIWGGVSDLSVVPTNGKVGAGLK